MNDLIFSINGKPYFHTSLQARLRTAVLVLCAALPSAHLLADETSADNVVSTSRPPIAWMSGGISEGLYLQLPPGSYRVSARINDIWKSKGLQVNRGGRIMSLAFVARNE
jgi:hypothetical protein